MTYRDIHHHIVKHLTTLYSQAEATEMAYRLMEHYHKVSKIDIALSSTEELQVNVQLSVALKRLEEGEPLQYVLGFAYFYDLKFKVNSSVLIPRPETEELVSLVLENTPRKELKILDIGTGSGCIPISIKKNQPFAQVSACDISTEALAIAKKNAEETQADVSFFQCDILNSEITDNYDVIVSNPPYVTMAEKELMRKNVLDFEPDLALFVENDTPLIFYKRIAEEAKKRLSSNGYLFFEINENFGLETVKMLKEKGFKNAVLLSDIFGKARFTMARQSD